MTETAKQFYSTSFSSTEADLICIDRAVQSDPTIMIVGCPLSKGDDQFKTIVGCTADCVVISCNTFRNEIRDEVGSSLVLWLLVAESESQKPSFISSWRWQGFGHLMLIMLIKHSTSLLLSEYELSHCLTRLFGVDIYLQCPYKEPQAFYHACGFLQINLEGTTGMEILPKTIASTLLDKDAQGFAWIVQESDDHCLIPLMQLCLGSFLKTAVDVQSKNETVNAMNGGPDSLLKSAAVDAV